MAVVKLTLAYDGTGFVGWQRQREGTSIQAIVEAALAPFTTGGPRTVVAAGRTDAGVHALAQVASASVADGIPPAELQRALNARLPPAVRVIAIAEAAPAFHARYAAVAKTYTYRIVNGPLISPFDVRYAWHVPGRLDRSRMQHAAADLIGTHDFAAFRATGTRVRDTRRTLHDAQLIAAGERLSFTCRGDGFLRHMVRTIVGTLVEIGHGRFEPERIASLLSAPDRTRVGPTAPPQGLFLVSVEY